MEIDKTAESIQSLLPDHKTDINSDFTAQRNKLVTDSAIEIEGRKTARELAALKLKEKQSIQRIKENEAEKRACGVQPGQTYIQKEKLKEHEANLFYIEQVEEACKNPLEAKTKSLVSPRAARAVLDLKSTTKADVLKLLRSLNINMNLQLTKTDTANLLACLLTCNESQLQALYSNKKVPLAIKTVIKRLLDDSKVGNTETIEKLWDRVFGKAAMTLDLPEAQQQNTSILPNVPVSREAYIVIRDTLLK